MLLEYIVTSSPQVLQSSIDTDANVSVDTIITKPALTSSRLQSDTTESNTPIPSHDNHPLLNDNRVTADDDVLKSEVTSDKVLCNDNLEHCIMYRFIVEVNNGETVGRIRDSS